MTETQSFAALAAGPYARGPYRSGRTTAMVRQLPDDGAPVTVFVATRASASYLHDMIRATRGDRLARAARILSTPGGMQLLRQLRGLEPSRVFFDHAVLEAMTSDERFDVELILQRRTPCPT